jgi:hypothetical protein
MSANPNYAGAAAVAVGNQIDKRFPAIWMVAQPLITILRTKVGNTNFNHASSLKGEWMLLGQTYGPPTIGSRVENSSNFAVPTTPVLNFQFTDPQYPYSTRSLPINYSVQDWQQLTSGKTQLADLVKLRTENMMRQFTVDWNTDLMGTNPGSVFTSGGNLTGLLSMMSTSNTVGGISQTTNAFWQAQVNTAGGPMGEALIVPQISKINSLNRMKADILLLSYNSVTQSSVYDRLFSQISATQMITKQGPTVDFGFETFIYKGLTCTMDNILGGANSAGSDAFLLLSSETFWVNWENNGIPARVPTMATMRGQGTVMTEDMYFMTMSFGCNDIACNAMTTNIT